MESTTAHSLQVAAAASSEACRLDHRATDPRTGGSLDGHERHVRKPAGAAVPGELWGSHGFVRLLSGAYASRVPDACVP